MNDQEKKSYLEKYKEAKEKGVPFFPDIIFKDAVVSLIIFAILVALTLFVGIPTEERANPADTSYTPRPEWYFLFLFQMLKYFPGNLEVIGVMVIPTIMILLIIALPFIDRNPKRFFLNRPLASLSALGVMGGIVVLTILSIIEAPPPQERTVVDQAAALYASNCANCHGPTISVPPGTDLHLLIAEGKHEGMPAWGGDLSTDEIDALAGFILSPNGSALFTQLCGDCHDIHLLATGNPLELQRVLELGPDFPKHNDLVIPVWNETLSVAERNALLNFLAAPDGQRLFSINCAGCHGGGVSYAGNREELAQLIRNGGQHLSMPGWRTTLSQSDLEILSAYVVDPDSNPSGATPFGQHCSSCHGETVPSAPDKDSARKIISSGGAHITMPVWGEILTPEQLDALVTYTLDASRGTSAVIGTGLFNDNCSVCHGQFGEGGVNPTLPGDIIAPISTAEYLKTRDNITLRNIIAQGQPNFGMSPFSTSYGGPLDDDQIDAIIAYMRSWEANPPVEFPPEVSAGQAALSGDQVYTEVCASCHGQEGQGGVGPPFNTTDFQQRYSDQEIVDVVGKGHEATPMIAWGGILTTKQIQQLVVHIRNLKPQGTGPTEVPSFANQVMPILNTKCLLCHNQQTKLGGWDASSYDAVINSGNNGPAVIKGNKDASILAQRILGTKGGIMPPSGLMPSTEIQLIINWILAGAPNN